MDVYCQHCAEPWDVYSVHHELDDERENATKDFLNGIGCPCCNWGKGESVDSFVCDAMGAMRDILGDDVDGIAAMLDDWAYIERGF